MRYAPRLPLTTWRGIATYGWIMSCLLSTQAFAQQPAVIMNDLAFVTERDFSRKQVLMAMDQFHASTQTGLSVTAVFENDLYARPAQTAIAHWIENQEHGVSILLVAKPETKSFLRCEVQASPAMPEWLPTKDRQQIQADLILVWKSYNAKRYVLKSTRMIRKLFTNFFFQLE